MRFTRRRSTSASIYDRLLESAEELGIINAGMYALLSLRIEKGFGIWSREFSRDYTPIRKWSCALRGV